MSDFLITNDPGLSVYFSVDIDGLDLGAWTTCSGLGIKIDTEPRGDSNMSFLMHQLSGRMTYENLTLGRPVSPDTAKVMTWLTAFSTLPVTTSAQVTALSTTGQPVMVWNLMGVVPTAWQGPSFDAASLSVATETLTIAYQGFL